LLQLSPNKRIHVMNALSCLAKFTGKYDVWLQITQRYKFEKYYKPERMALEHFRFPEVFFRQTKKVTFHL
jgi:hypothetical protein